MVDGLVDEVGHVLVAAVAELHPAEVPRRDAPQVVRLDAELRHVPGVDREAAVRRVGALDDRERRVEVVHVHVERHELVDHPRVVLLAPRRRRARA